MPRVVIVFTGGTISMRPDAAAGGNVPVLDGAGILALSPDVARVADVEVIDWGRVPASHLRMGQILSIARVVDEQLRRADVDGVVVVQGTDVIEETAFAFDLLLQTDKTVVVTGAMRDASAPDFDGPHNLADAVHCAAAPELRSNGVLVVLDGTVIAAGSVVKKDTTALNTFQARDGEPLAQLVDRSIIPVSARRPWTVLPAIPDSAPDDVHLITAGAGIDGTLVRGIAASRPAGLVVAATGSGNTHPDLLAAASELMGEGTVVALTTRCATGTVVPLYAFPGGGATWQRAGAIMSRFDGPKSRVALALGLGAGFDREQLARLLREGDA
jgi:L-asparaginase